MSKPATPPAANSKRPPDWPDAEDVHWLAGRIFESRCFGCYAVAQEVAELVESLNGYGYDDLSRRKVLKSLESIRTAAMVVCLLAKEAVDADPARNEGIRAAVRTACSLSPNPNRSNGEPAATERTTRRRR